MDPPPAQQPVDPPQELLMAAQAAAFATASAHMQEDSTGKGHTKMARVLEAEPTSRHSMFATLTYIYL